MDAVEPRAGVDGWSARSGMLYGRPARWLERPLAGEPGTVEQVFLEAPLVERACAEPARLRDSRVLLSASARDAILHHACWESGHDGLETGGWLYGDCTASGVVVAHATGPGPRAVRTTHSLALDHSDRAQFELRQMWGEPQTSRIGKWHTHPGGPAEPSAVDLESWSAGLDVINRETSQPYYVAVIACDETRSWELHTWLVSRSRTGKTVVERVRLEDLDAQAA